MHKTVSSLSSGPIGQLVVSNPIGQMVVHVIIFHM